MKKPPSKEKLIVVCHNIRSAYNIGSIFRTADAAGVSKIILGGYCPPVSHPKVAKTALGAEKSIPSESIKQTWRALDQLKKEGFKIAALELSSTAKNIFEYEPKFPMALVLGNEVKGLSKEIIERCDDIIEIPMQGQKESLNVSVAFGIAVYILKF